MYDNTITNSIQIIDLHFVHMSGMTFQDRPHITRDGMVMWFAAKYVFEGIHESEKHISESAKVIHGKQRDS